MKAFILAAGLGTRLRPWTLNHPKALVPVGGIPMLQRVILNLKNQGFTYIVVNVHHFASQIVNFIRSFDFGVEIKISDESDCLMDTGGALLQAASLLYKDDEPFLVHNVDILSNADLGELMNVHKENEERGGLSTLLVNDRDTSRRLVFDDDMALRGWHNRNEDRFKPDDFRMEPDFREYAFSGIYVMSPAMLRLMKRRGMSGPFPIIDFFLGLSSSGMFPRRVLGYNDKSLSLIDIGKPESLEKADSLLL